MIYSEQNEKGIITFNKSILNQVIAESVNAWTYTGKLKLLNERTVATSEEGLYLCVHISLAIGESISEVANSMLTYLSQTIINSFELEIDDIVVILDSMFTAKGTLIERNMQFSYRGNQNI